MSPILEEKLKILRQYKPALKEKYNVDKIGVFGSYSRGEQKEDSDIDVLVEFFEPIGLFDFVGLQMELSEQLGKKVDLATKNALKPLIKDSILNDLIYA